MTFLYRALDMNRVMAGGVTGPCRRSRAGQRLAGRYRDSTQAHVGGIARRRAFSSVTEPSVGDTLCGADSSAGDEAVDDELAVDDLTEEGDAVVGPADALGGLDAERFFVSKRVESVGADSDQNDRCAAALRW